MNRTIWTFPYTVAQLLEAAEAKAAYHSTRVAWWSDKRDATVAKLKAEGIEINESIVEREAKIGYSNTMRGFRQGMSVELNPELVEDINECTGKITEHKARVKEYAGWVSVFKDQPGTRNVDLHHDDWLYFFGK